MNEPVKKPDPWSADRVHEDTCTCARCEALKVNGHAQDEWALKAAEHFPWCIMYRTPYDDGTVVALFSSESNAQNTVALWRKGLQFEEDLEVKQTSKVLR